MTLPLGLALTAEIVARIYVPARPPTPPEIPDLWARVKGALYMGVPA